MPRWFLSHHFPDRALAERVKVALERKGSSVFYAPASLRAGGYWQEVLAEEIAKSDAFILLIGPSGIGDWQVPEYYEAQSRSVKERSFPLVLVLLKDQAAPGLAFLRQFNWIVTPDPASEACLARLIEVAEGKTASPGELWRYTTPYRGLTSMKAEDSDYFFGRGRETVEVLNTLASAPHKLPVLLGNSGVGKSSLAQAGVLAALARQSWPETAGDVGPWPAAFANSRQWCFLTLRPGTEPVTALVETFMDIWQFDASDPARIRRRNEWVDLLLHDDKRTNFAELLDATERRQKELNRAKPPGFFLYIDQGEELYVRSEERQRRRFSELLATGLGDPRLRALMSIRSDFLGALQNDAPLFDAHHKIDVPALRQAQLRDVVSRPAALLSARFETDHLAADIARCTAEESAKDAGALPLLSYLLDDMWSQMIKRADGVLRLPPTAMELGGVLAERADAFLGQHPQSEDALRRLLTLKLATVREDGEPTRRRALRSEFTNEEWRLVSELADHPNRLLVTAAPEVGETYAEVAHEAIFRRWEKLKEWIAAEREFLIWKTGLESDRRAWDATAAATKTDALLMGVKLAQAQGWLVARRQDLSDPDRQFIEQSVEREVKDRAQREGQRRRIRQMAALVGVLICGIGAGFALTNRDYLQARAVTLYEAVFPRTLSTAEERALKPGQTFKECAHCPEMVMVPAGQFMMGSPKEEKGHQAVEEPRHLVTIAQPIAVGRFEITSEEWDACVLLGGCTWSAPETGWGRGRRPVMNVNWDDAQQYVTWLSRRTGKHYRLLSESEWEYAARAGSDKAYSWGDEIGKNNANCNGCGSEWDFKQSAPVGSFAPNTFGLHDMHGNVFEWTQDCFHNNYNGAPPDGSAWEASGDCSRRVVRGGSWFYNPGYLRSAARLRGLLTGYRVVDLGFRVARTLVAP